MATTSSALVLKLLALLATNFILANQSAASATSDKNDGFVLINNYLVKNVAKSDDIDSNLAKAVELFELETRKLSGVSSAKNYFEALKMFTSLKRTREVKCSQESANILKANNDATGGMAHLKGIPLHNRVAKLVYQVSLEHAKECQDVYPARYAQLVAKMNQLLLKRARNFTDQINTRAVQFELNTVSRGTVFRPAIGHCLKESRLGTVWGLTMCEYAKQAYLTLLSLAQLNDENSANNNLQRTQLDWQQQTDESENNDENYRQHQKEKLRSAFNKYLLEPCQYFVSTLGPDVFVLASFDSELYFHINDRKESNYLADWDRYRVCERFIKLDKENALLETMMQNFIESNHDQYN